MRLGHTSTCLSPLELAGEKGKISKVSPRALSPISVWGELSIIHLDEKRCEEDRWSRRVTTGSRLVMGNYCCVDRHIHSTCAALRGIVCAGWYRTCTFCISHLSHALETCTCSTCTGIVCYSNCLHLWSMNTLYLETGRRQPITYSKSQTEWFLVTKLYPNGVIVALFSQLIEIQIRAITWVPSLEKYYGSTIVTTAMAQWLWLEGGSRGEC